MGKGIRSFIAVHVWPFSEYQKRLCCLSDKISEMSEEQIKKEHLLEELKKELKEKKSIENCLNDLTRHIAELDEDKKCLWQKCSQLEKEKKDLDEKYRMLCDGNRLGIPSGRFWEEHYQKSGNSGTGSYGRLAEFKAEIVNRFMEKEEIRTTVEIGCGDGNQLSLIHYQNYTGIDVSAFIIEKNRMRYQDDPKKQFFCADADREKYISCRYEMSISMDVIFHLLEDQVFYRYMEDLFLLAERFVVIYSSNHEEYTRWPEYRHRNFISYIQEKISGWELYQFIPNRYPYKIGMEESTSASDFYIFKKIG